MSAPAERGWHVGAWGELGWAETLIKLAGVGVGIAALVMALDRPADGAGGARLVAAILLGVLSLLLVAGIADRLMEREVIGALFVPAMVIGHVAMLVAVARDPQVGAMLHAFAGLMFAGDVVKLVFLQSTGFRVRALPPTVVYGLVGTFVAGYVALGLLAYAI